MDVQLPQPISRIVFRCSEQTKTELVSKMQIHEGSMLTDELLQQARETAKAYNEWLSVLVKQSLRQEEYLKSAPEMRKTFLAPAIDQGVNVVIWDRAIPPERIRIDGTEHNSRLIEKPMPTYRGGDEVFASAVVKLAIIIGNDGSILEIDPLAGPEPLISPAVDAVRRWKYQPTLAEWPPRGSRNHCRGAFSGGEVTPTAHRPHPRSENLIGLDGRSCRPRLGQADRPRTNRG